MSTFSSAHIQPSEHDHSQKQTRKKKKKQMKSIEFRLLKSVFFWLLDPLKAEFLLNNI
jgi:hypothetical protein